jgi:hypothetical protein
MSRRKGELTSARIERDWREQVEFRPENGALGPAVNEMHRFCVGMDHASCTLRSAAGDFILVWGFKVAADADAFQARFGGKRVTAPDAMTGEAEWRRWKRRRRECARSS